MALVAGVALFALGEVNASRLLLIPVATVSIGIRSWPGLRSLSKFGDLSYGTYIWGWPVQQVTRLWLSASSAVWLQLLVVVPQVLLVAFISWHLIEKRALRLKPRVAQAPPAAKPWWHLEVGSIRETSGRLAKFFGRD